MNHLSIEALTSASRRGDLDAMTELGHRLLIGDGAPKLPRHALTFLLEATKAGAPRAMARVAALMAGGAYVKQDWQGALHLLGQAAAAGDTAARGQLTCLQPTDAIAADWTTMAARRVAWDPPWSTTP